MQHIRAVLRRTAAEKNMTGGNAARDSAINRFLDELGLLLTPRMILTIDDETMAGMYVDWVKALPHLTAEQRVDALINDIRLSIVPFLVYRKGYHQPKAVDNPINVVPLHARQDNPEKSDP